MVLNPQYAKEVNINKWNTKIVFDKKAKELITAGGSTAKGSPDPFGAWMVQPKEGSNNEWTVNKTQEIRTRAIIKMILAVKFLKLLLKVRTR